MRVAVLALVCVVHTLAAENPYKVTTGVEYTRPGGVSVLLDAHIPDGDGPFPAVILVHGGGWTAGDRTAAFIQPLFRVLDQTGFAWFTIDYRRAPEFAYPAAADDVESAVRFVKQHAKEYRVDPAKVALMGESAGGHLVNLVGARNDAGVAAVVCFYGPIDMLLWAKDRLEGKPLSDGVRGFFGIQALDEAGWRNIRQTSPRIYLQPQDAAVSGDSWYEGPGCRLFTGHSDCGTLQADRRPMPVDYGSGRSPWGDQLGEGSAISGV